MARDRLGLSINTYGFAVAICVKYGYREITILILCSQSDTDIGHDLNLLYTNKKQIVS